MGKGIGGDWNKQPENWQRPEDFIPYFRAQCFQLDQCLFGLGATLYQMGPPPGAYTTYFNNPSIFPNNPYIPTGDHYSSSTKSSDLFAPLRKSKKKSSAETANEKIAKAREKAEKNKLVEKYKNIYNILEKYKETLNDTTEPTKSEYEEVLKYYKSSTPTSSQTTDQINEKISDIIALYDEYNGNENKIQTAYETYVKSNLTSATGDSKHSTAVTSLNNWINNPIEDDFGGILEKDSGGNIVWAEEDDAPKYDIMELLSTWNSTDSIKNNHVIQTIINKYNGLKGDDVGVKKDYLVTLALKMCNQLEDRAGKILNQYKDKLSADTKNALKTAKNALPDTFSAFTNVSNLSQQFDSLYHAIRIAEAELADKDLQEKFAFLDTNPYASHSEFTTNAMSDLASERVYQSFPSDPVAFDSSILEPMDLKDINGTKIRIGKYEYKLSVTGNEIKIFSVTSNVNMTDTLGKITVYKNNMGYSLEKDGVKTYYNLQGEKIKVENIDNNKSNKEQLERSKLNGKTIKYNGQDYTISVTPENKVIIKDPSGNDKTTDLGEIMLYSDDSYSLKKDGTIKNYTSNGTLAGTVSVKELAMNELNEKTVKMGPVDYKLIVKNDILTVEFLNSKASAINKIIDIVVYSDNSVAVTFVDDLKTRYYNSLGEITKTEDYTDGNKDKEYTINFEQCNGYKLKFENDTPKIYICNDGNTTEVTNILGEITKIGIGVYELRLRSGEIYYIKRDGTCTKQDVSS